MFYIHQTACISPQQTFPEPDITVLHQPVEGKMKVREPKYEGIPPGALRRMSKSVRLGMGAALPLLKQWPCPDGIVIGTANAGFEDCFHFLKQIVDYDEGQLTPGSFVQSTPNALAAQLSMISHDKNYNITHGHLGLAFENAMTDVAMLVAENAGGNYLLGAVDDISPYNYALSALGGWFKEGAFDVQELYDQNSGGTIAGEGAAMFLVNSDSTGAIAELVAAGTIHTGDVLVAGQKLSDFIALHLPAGEKIDLLISGEDGDNRLLKYYTAFEEIGEAAAVIRFKHMSGEYPTASAMALWLACFILQGNSTPQHIIKTGQPPKIPANILICNSYRGTQHSFILVKAPAL